ncbi:rhodanese-like domain-containing protein [Candidatus Kaiserbacteria bacterium]|nr:rhodanese-like domain-containing protein [Candidatus Kaiserbacteria bacterium]NCT02025.1 rhodanese-like domain-containing protein [Candidatus Parcubacteria bacterium]
MTIDELNTSEKQTILLVDIREPAELAALPMLTGSINIPMSRITAAVGTPKLPRDKKIVTICYSGARCFAVNEYLKAQGYSVDYLEGGISSLQLRG